MIHSRSVVVGLVCLLLYSCAADATGDSRLAQEAGGGAATATPSAPMDTSQPSEGGQTGLDGPGAARAAASGSSCSCDADCVGDEAHPGVCVYGVCMRTASGACSAGGSRAECPADSRCWALDEAGQYPLCWPDCAKADCAGECDAEGSCVPTTGDTCDAACGSHCPAPAVAAATDLCSPSNPTGRCPEEALCTDGTCIRDGCPDWRCAGGCSELVAMPGSQDPSSAEAMAAGYYIATERRYAFLRRDLTLLLQYAACEVAKRFGGTQPVGISDMSQADGLTPGTVECGPECARHPTSTHRGDDIDVAYFQTDGMNDPQIICGDGSDNNNNGRVGRHNDGYFCTTQANIIDWPRQLWWFAKLAESPLVRVTGIDQTLTDDFQKGARQLYEQGEVTNAVYGRMLALGAGNEGGWAFHHHHTHHSYNRSATPRQIGGAPAADCSLHMSCPPFGDP